MVEIVRLVYLVYVCRYNVYEGKPYASFIWYIIVDCVKWHLMSVSSVATVR